MAHSKLFSLITQRRFLPFFITQALGALNDNVFKNALVILIAFRISGLSSSDVDFYSNLAAGLFILPFFLFCGFAGQLAEKYEKSVQIQRIKLAEIVIMALGSAGLMLGSLPLMLAVLFCLGAQSAFFGPLKYGILPQHLEQHELVAGNGWVEAGTFMAILAGTLVGGLVVASMPEQGAMWASVIVVSLAVVGYLTSRMIPKAAASAPDLVIDKNPITATISTLGSLKGNRDVLLSVLAVSWFWFFGSIFIAQLPNYTRLFLGGNEQVAPLVLTLFSVGVGLGSLLCERLSGGKIEIGLVPFGALGLTIFGVDLYFAKPEAATVTGLTAMQFLQAAGNWRVALDLFLLGVFGGFYIVPLFALIQSRAEPSKLSRVIAANNIINALFMVAAALMAIVLLKSGVTIPQLLLITAILNALVAVYIFTVVPEFFLRFLGWIAINLLYRVKVEGLEHIPDEGAVILAPNHISFMDPVLITGTVRRPIRFIMSHRIFAVPGLNWVFRTMKAIPIAGAREDKAVMDQAFVTARSELDEGHVVGIFPEGGLTPDGEIQSFKGGIERLLDTHPVPVIPVAVRGMWGSMFSRSYKVTGRKRLPRFRWNRVALIFGEPIPADQVTRQSLQARVEAMRGDVR